MICFDDRVTEPILHCPKCNKLGVLDATRFFQLYQNNLPDGIVSTNQRDYAIHLQFLVKYVEPKMSQFKSKVPLTPKQVRSLIRGRFIKNVREKYDLQERDLDDYDELNHIDYNISLPANRLWLKHRHLSGARFQIQFQKQDGTIGDMYIEND